jgi:hypothetical protein
MTHDHMASKVIANDGDDDARRDRRRNCSGSRCILSMQSLHGYQDAPCNASNA